MNMNAMQAQVLALAGCDLLTISPALLDELARSHEPVHAQLGPHAASNGAPAADAQGAAVTAASFAWALTDDEMAHFKLGEGIRKFAADLVRLEQDVAARLHA